VATGLSFALFGLGGLILGYMILPVIALLSRTGDTEKRRCRYLIHRSFAAFIWFMKITGVLTWEISGRELLEREGQVIVANHPTLIDIVFLISMIPNASCIVKSDVYHNMFMRGPVSWAGYVPNHSPEQLITDCVAELEKGTSLVIFPEGTRTRRHLPLRLKRGAAHILLNAGCEASLVTIQCTPPSLGKHEKWYEIPPRRMHFRLDVIPDPERDFNNRLERDNMRARAITKDWQSHFTKKVIG